MEEEYVYPFKYGQNRRWNVAVSFKGNLFEGTESLERRHYTFRFRQISALVTNLIQKNENKLNGVKEYTGIKPHKHTHVQFFHV
jgi:hypothetical protein